VRVKIEDPPAAAGLGLKVAEMVAGSPLVPRVTLPAKPFTTPIDTV